MTVDPGLVTVRRREVSSFFESSFVTGFDLLLVIPSSVLRTNLSARNFGIHDDDKSNISIELMNISADGKKCALQNVCWSVLIFEKKFGKILLNLQVGFFPRGVLAVIDEKDPKIIVSGIVCARLENPQDTYTMAIRLEDVENVIRVLRIMLRRRTLNIPSSDSTDSCFILLRWPCSG